MVITFHFFIRFDSKARSSDDLGIAVTLNCRWELLIDYLDRPDLILLRLSALTVAFIPKKVLSLKRGVLLILLIARSKKFRG